MRQITALLSLLVLIGCGSSSSVTAPEPKDEPVGIMQRYDSQPVKYGLRYVAGGELRADSTQNIQASTVAAMWIDTTTFRAHSPRYLAAKPGWWVVMEANRRSKAFGLDTVYSWDRIDSNLAVRAGASRLPGMVVRYDSIVGLRARKANGFRLPTPTEAQYLWQSPIVNGEINGRRYVVDGEERSYLGIPSDLPMSEFDGNAITIVRTDRYGYAMPWFVRDAI
jgi:hypothetical protein